MIGVVHLKYGDGSAGTGDIDSLQSPVEFDYIRPAGHWQESDGLVAIQIEYSHQVVSFAGEKRAVIFGVNCHAMIPCTAPDGIFLDNLIGGWIDHGENILVLQIDIHSLRYRIVLRHSCFALKAQR